MANGKTPDEDALKEANGKKLGNETYRYAYLPNPEDDVEEESR